MEWVDVVDSEIGGGIPQYRLDVLLGVGLALEVDCRFGASLNI